MNERKGELALAALKVNIRKQLAIRDIANIRRDIGNLVKEPEMVAIKAKPEELLNFSRLLLKEVLEAQLKAI